MAQQLASEKSLFLEALEIESAAGRNRFLDEACHGDAPQRAKVQALLDAHARPQPLLDITSAPPHEMPGALIGPYKLLEQIGEGGMGLVYMAEQQRPLRRLVALKIIKPGMDSRQVIARFEAEKQALAMMDHPNIAKVFDAGTTGEKDEGERMKDEIQTLASSGSSFIPHHSSFPSSRPYFVMELVRGIPINEFCDRKRLSVRERLALFIQVCQAVQHAHQKGIIHRDLKPSNVLVTLHDVLAVPKVIDFGIAKAIGDFSLATSTSHQHFHTGFAQLVGTPLYMSPEQAEMNQLGVDTRSDVYSLGVLLYELLTGTTPFDKDRLKSASFDEMRRIIREEEPETVSARLARTRRVGSAHQTPLPLGEGADGHRREAVVGEAGEGVRYSQAPSPHSPAPERSELDWIVMKSLEKDRTRRYESASALAADIQRYLSDEPVLACPPTTMYRFQKFARKHKPALATAAAIALCLLLGTTVSAWQAARATQAETQANANEQKAVANAVTAQEKEQEAIKQRDEVKALADKLVAKDQQLQRTLYAAHMNLAHNAFEAGAPGRLRELLAQHRPQPGEPDLRGFEWHYLNRLFPADLLVLKHPSRAISVAYSPDGKRLATTSLGTGDGTGPTLTVWDAQAGAKLFSHTGIHGQSTVTFSPDGKRVASNGKIWDAETGQELLSLSRRNPFSRMAFSPDGKRVATGSLGDGQIAIWDAQTGERLLPLEGSSSQIRGMAFSPDGKRLACASAGKTVKLWDAESGQLLQTLQLAHNFLGFAFSPDGKRLASASDDKTVKLWDALSGNEIRTLRGHTSIVFNVAFSPDGKRLASASDDSTVKVWDVESGDELFALRGHAQAVRGVSFSPDGQRLASASEDGTVKVRKANAVQKALVLDGGATYVTNVAFSPDGKRLTSVDRLGFGPNVYEAKVWDTQTGEKLLALNAGENADAALSSDGRRVAGVSFRPNEAKIWDLLVGEKLLTIPMVGNSLQLALSPDGNRLVTIIGDSLANGRPPIAERKLWDVKTGQEIRSLNAAVNNVVFSPDGKRLAGIYQGKILKLSDAQTGDEILTLKGAAGAVAFSPDGKRLACGSDDQTVAKVWDAQTGAELLSLQGHSGAITCVAFSPDTKRLATTSSDATTKVWDSESGQELLTLAGHSGRTNGAAFSPDGNRLAAGGPNGTVMIYDATPQPEKP
jgi:eukaryotic-like serine/threonine-protein kinase